MITKVNDTVLYQTEEGWISSAPLVVTSPIASLLTDDPEGHPRLRVDVAQTGFFRGREFRTFRRIDTAAGATRIIKVVVPVNVILFGLQLTLTDGWIDMETRVGGTEGGTFAEVLPVFGRNNMTTTPSYTPQVVLSTGGTLTGGTVLDVLAVKTSNATAQASSVGTATTDERGVAPNTYHFVITNPGSGSASGVFKLWWEERP